MIEEHPALSCPTAPLAATPGEPAAAPLGATQISDYGRRGWVMCPEFFSVQETAAIRRWTDEVVLLPELPGTHMLYRESSCLDADTRLIQRIENFCPHHPQLDELIRRGRLHRAVEQLIGRSAVLFKEKINFKMPGGAGFEAHQDQQAGWSVYAPVFITAMVSIDAATIDNGCLEVSTKPRRTRMIGKEWSPLSAAELRDDVLSPIATRPGDVLFFDSFVPHASKPNRTAQSRRILYLTFNAAEYGDQRERYYAAKRAAFPPDVERDPRVEYRFRV